MKKYIIKKAKIIKKNPQINSSQLAEVIKIIEELRSNGIKPADYNISSPFTKRIKIFSDSEDSPVIHFK